MSCSRITALALSLVALASTSRAQVISNQFDFNFADLANLSVQPIIQTGQPGGVSTWIVSPPKVGELFKLRVTWTVANGPLTGGYTMRIDLAEKHFYVPATVAQRQNGTHTLELGPYALELDGTIATGGSLDIYWTSGEMQQFKSNNSFVGSFSPTLPSQAVEFYGAKTWDVEQTSRYTLPAGTSSAQFMLAKPISDGYASIANASATLSSHVLFGNTTFHPLTTSFGNTAFAPVYNADIANPLTGLGTQWTFRQQFTATCSNVRVNPNLLRNTTWSQLDALTGIFAFQEYLTADPGVIAPATTKLVNPDVTCVMPVGHSTFVQYLQANLGANYRSTYTPYDAARRIYSCVLRDMTYTANPDTKPHHSLAILYYGLGDCGGYSLLISTLFRTMGIPCRIVVNEHHAWNEFYLPNAGWIPCDASYHDAQLCLTTSQYAYGFGVRRDLANFVPLARGTDFNVGGLEHKWFQAPFVFRNHVQTSWVNATSVDFVKQ
jgi:hypothetical protein